MMSVVPILIIVLIGLFISAVRRVLATYGRDPSTLSTSRAGDIGSLAVVAVAALLTAALWASVVYNAAMVMTGNRPPDDATWTSMEISDGR
ncbi:MAG: hypothetical protein BMS9Abin07_1803 [Acidimicrobiia bacterium]|nr:MAG: hypothetical protein BMS9Abin07_1803 [Acidimicrobiia bacterium]